MVKLLMTSVKPGCHPKHLDAEAPVNPTGVIGTHVSSS